MVVASAASTILISRLLGAAGAGRAAYGIWLASTVAQVALFALPQVALRFLASPGDRPGLARWLTRRAALLAAPATVAALSLSAASGESRSLVAATALLTAASMAGTMGQAVLLGNQEYRRLTVLSLAAAAIQVTAAAVWCTLAGPTGGILASAASQAPLLLGLWSPLDGREKPSAGVIRRVQSFALHSWVASTFSIVAWSRLEFVFLKGFGSDVVGQYAAALAIAQLGLQPAALVGNALLPHFGELVGGAHTDASRETYAAVTRVSALLSLPLCLGLAGVAPALVRALFGEPFAAATSPASLLVAAASFVAIAPAATAITYAHERTRYISTAGVVSAATATVAFWLFIPRFGSIGAAMARGLIQTGGVAAGFWYVHHSLGATFPLRRVLRAAAAAALAALAGRVVVTLIPSPWTALAAGVATVILTYAILVPRLGAIERSDVTHLNRIVSPVPGALGDWARRYLRALAG
jgi:O-antigen/teichoic acid export membrane protein